MFWALLKLGCPKVRISLDLNPALLLPYMMRNIFWGYTAETRGPFFWGLGIDHTTHNLDWDCKPCGGLVAFDVFTRSSIFLHINEWSHICFVQEFGAIEFYAGNGNVSKCFNASGIRCAALDILYPIDGSDGHRSNPMDILSVSGFWFLGPNLYQEFLYADYRVPIYIGLNSLSICLLFWIFGLEFRHIVWRVWRLKNPSVSKSFWEPCKM